MKFVYFGYDFMLGGVRRLLGEGHELAGVFTFECDNVFNFNRESIALAQGLKIPVILSPPQDAHIESFLHEGVQCFLAAGYPYKIPAIPQDRAYGINLHPSFLPKGRGLMPTPHILLHAPEAAGMTAHKIADALDAGDILWQEKFNLAPEETVETYSARMALRGPEVLSMLLADLPHHWQNAKPQKHKQATWFGPPDEAMRFLDWNAPVAVIARTGRAFGRFGSLARFDENTWVVYDLDVWTEKHEFPPGTVAARLSREVVIAAKDGFVCLKDFQPARP